MEHKNIKDFKIMYLLNSIGFATTVGADSFGLNTVFDEKYINRNNIIYANLYLYNYLISNNDGVTHFKTDLKMHCYLKLNELLFDNFDNKNKVLEKFKDINEIKNLGLIKLNNNTMHILTNDKQKSKSEYYSLIFLAVPFAIKINNKNNLIKEIETFIKNFTDDENQILSTITCGLFINYALNNINIEKWIENLNNDIKNIKSSEKYLDYINYYLEINFRNGHFIERKIDNIVVERNNAFFTNNFCEKNNRIFGEKPQQQVLIILDSLLRGKDNWEKVILYGLCNFGDNIIMSIIIGVLYDIIFSSAKINKNLLKRFSFN